VVEKLPEKLIPGEEKRKIESDVSSPSVKLNVQD
jgi:hypothetical protein